MRGYSEGELRKRHANIANYVGCLNCRLHWHRRVFEKHINVAAHTRGLKRQQIEIIHPAWERFIEFLVEGAVKQVMAEHGYTLRPGERLGRHRSETPPKTERRRGEPIRVTVDEAVARYGFSREEIMAEFDRNKVPFEVELRSPSSRPRATTAQDGEPIETC